MKWPLPSDIFDGDLGDLLFPQKAEDKPVRQIRSNYTAPRVSRPCEIFSLASGIRNMALAIPVSWLTTRRNSGSAASEYTFGYNRVPAN